MIHVQCECGTTLKAPDGLAGKQAACPKCRAPITVPHPVSQPAAPAASNTWADVPLLTAPAVPTFAAPVPPTTTPISPSRSAAPSPYVYRMVQIPPTVFVRRSGSNDAARYLEDTVNGEAQFGWEFHRIDRFSVEEPAGCLSVLRGVSTIERDYQVITFRRPRP